MKVILLKDIKDLGKKYEIKEVSNGYAKNYLLKRGLAKAATSKEVSKIENFKELERKKKEEEKEKMKETAEKIHNKEFKMKMKVGEKGELFESITPRKIADKLEEEGFQVSKEQVELEEPIKALGEYPVKINFVEDVSSEIKLTIEEES